MRVTVPVLLFATLALLLAICACGGGEGGGDQPSPPQPAPEQPAEPEEPAEPVPIDFSGQSASEFITKWAELGENQDDILAIAETDDEGNYIDPYEWHISEIAMDTMDTYQMQLEPGEYFLAGYGGMGLVNLDFYVLGEDAESEDDYLDYDDAEDKMPMASFELEEPQSIMIRVDPVEFEEGREGAVYCWALYKDL